MRSPNYFAVTDDVHEGVERLVKVRLPWLIVGLFGGMVVTLMVSRFENILSANLKLAFFIPIIVYLADAVGTQTETIYVRNLSKFKDNFYKYLAKEVLVGVCLGFILGALITIAAFLWLRSFETAITVGLAMFINIIIAPVIAIVVPEILFKEKVDPALGGGPFTTIIQQGISLLVYFLVASTIIL